jgi:hypothetical protein
MKQFGFGDPFDPLDTWFDISPDEQPPDHYKLLGIERFETDPQAIADGYEARIQHLDQQLNGLYGADAEQLKVRVGQAYGVLKDGAKRAKYDASLREADEDEPLRLQPLENSPSPLASKRSPKQPVQVVTAAPAQLSQQQPKKKSPVFEIIGIVLGGLAAIPASLLVLYFLFGLDPLGVFPEKKPVAVENKEAETPPVLPPIPPPPPPPPPAP